MSPISPQPSPRARRPLSKLEIALFALVPLLLAVIAFSAFWNVRINAEPQISIPAPAPLPNPNGYDFYVAASKSIITAKPPVDPSNDVQNLILTNPPLATQNFSLARKTAWLQVNATGFALFKKATQTPCRPPASRSLRDFSISRNFSKFRQMARDKAIETRTLVLQKKPFEATQSALDNVQMGVDIARGGALMSKLVGSAIVAIARDPLSDANALPELLSAPQARAAAARLETILANRTTFADALAEDKWVALTNVQEIWNDPKFPNWRSSAASPNWTWKDKWAARTVSKTDIAARVAAKYDIAIANAKLPYGATPAPFPAPADPISDIFWFSSRTQSHESREIVPLHLLLLRFALRAYRLENGRFPANLNALAPKFLKFVPTDYYSSGKPFFFRLKGQNYELWSVGPDGVNNNGTPIPPRGKMPRFPGLPQVQLNSIGDWVAGKNR